MATKTQMAETVTAVNESAAAAAKQGFDQTVNGLKDGMAQAAAGFEKTQAKMKEGVEKAMKTAEEFVAFGQGNMEAFVKSGQIWAAGVQDLQKQMAATAQASFEEAVATFKALTTQHRRGGQGAAEDPQARHVQGADAERRLHADGVRRARPGAVLPKEPGGGDPNHATCAPPRRRRLRRLYV
jgi:hypothetical protein